MKEIWKDIKGYEGLYQISNLGNVKSLSRTIINYRGSYTSKEIIMKTYFLGGYKRIGLLNNKIVKRILIHRLVAEAFIPNPKNKRDINHINGIKSDNRVENLEWNTRSENVKHAYNIGLNPKLYGKNNKHSKIVLQYSLENIFIKKYYSITEAGKENNICRTDISSVCSGRLKTAGGYKWKIL
ncbi:MAG: endonuclease [Spirochaetia bacterium]|nr:endonuclease [Spirochaetia bacterium]